MNLHQLELQVWDWFQKITDALPILFSNFLSFFDGQAIIAILIAITWISFNSKWGARLFYLVSFSALCNYMLKETFQLPRPLNSEIGLAEAQGFGFPSEVAQTTLLIGAFLLKLRKNKWIWLLFLNLIFWVCLAYLYLGVYFPVDIIGGWTVGGSIWLIYRRIGFQLEQYLARQPKWLLIILSQLVPFGLLLFYYNVPMIRLVGTAMGVGLGLSINIYDTPIQKNRKKIKSYFFVRMVISLLGIGIIYYIGSYFDVTQSDYTVLIKFFLLGLWISLGGNFLFNKLFPYMGKWIKLSSFYN